MEDNYYQYKASGNVTVKGFFKIYQARNGSIILCMANNHTALSSKQIVDLGIDVYCLEDFDMDSFEKYYVEIIHPLNNL